MFVLPGGPSDVATAKPCHPQPSLRSVHQGELQPSSTLYVCMSETFKKSYLEVKYSLYFFAKIVLDLVVAVVVVLQAFSACHKFFVSKKKKKSCFCY